MIKPIRKKSDIIWYYLHNLIQSKKSNAIQSNFEPGWKKVSSEKLNIENFKTEHRIIESKDSKLISDIDIHNEDDGTVSEDIYPMK
tara:strand:+ start:227 stop:484 length:258 start_codon:yes stop_codon:yes gene_type:complete